MTALKVEQMDDDGHPYFYVFTDVAELFWPGDYGKDNHTAEERVRQRLEEQGCERIASALLEPKYRVPGGLVGFDSESGGFECHSRTAEAVEYVIGVINEIKNELDGHRAALR